MLAKAAKSGNQIREQANSITLYERWQKVQSDTQNFMKSADSYSAHLSGIFGFSHTDVFKTPLFIARTPDRNSIIHNAQHIDEDSDDGDVLVQLKAAPKEKKDEEIDPEEPEFLGSCSELLIVKYSGPPKPIHSTSTKLLALLPSSLASSPSSSMTSLPTLKSIENSRLAEAEVPTLTISAPVPTVLQSVSLGSQSSRPSSKSNSSPPRKLSPRKFGPEELLKEERLREKKIGKKRKKNKSR